MTATLTAGSLFSGYGGLDKAIEEVFGARTAWVSDIDAGACKVLMHRYPDVPNLGDVSAVDWSTVEPVDIIGGGFPCQDVSGAGRQAGLVAGTRSGLWHEFARAIRELRPRWVVIENVRGLMSSRGAMPVVEHLAAEATRDACDHLLAWINDRHAHAVRQGRTDDAQRLITRRARTLGCRKRAVARARRHERRLIRALGTVLGTLADLGYDAQWRCIKASDVGAPHERFRVFILATAQDADVAAGGERWLPAPGQEESRGAWPDAGGRDRAPVALLQTPSVADSMGGHERRGGERGDELLLNGQVKALFPTPTTQDAANDGGPSQYDRNSLPLNTLIKTLPTPRATRGGSATETMYGLGGERSDDHRAQGTVLLPTPASMSAANDPGSVESWTARRDRMLAKGINGNGIGTPLGIAIQQEFGRYAAAVQRWEAVTGMPAPAPTEPTGKGGAHRLSPRFTEWMMGQPAGWITDVPDITRNEALKLCGNGVVTQQAIAALSEMLRYQHGLAA